MKRDALLLTEYPGTETPVAETRAAGALRKRKRLPRTFDRRPKPWMEPLLQLPDRASERMLSLRRDALKLSRADAARLLRVARNTIWDWETGYRTAPFSAYLAMHLIAESLAGRQAPKPAAVLVEQRASQLSRGQDVLKDIERRLRAMRAEYKRKWRHGEIAPLERDPATGKRPRGTGRYPSTGVYTRGLMPAHTTDEPRLEGRYRSRRERANELQGRMSSFGAIYNAGYMVRHAYFAPDERQRVAVMKFVAVMLQEFRATQDYEACLFAVADALYASPLGVPWEP